MAETLARQAANRSVMHDDGERHDRRRAQREKLYLEIGISGRMRTARAEAAGSSHDHSKSQIA